ncbi:MAG: response regulator [Magnetococcus sp. MYC-9]
MSITPIPAKSLKKRLLLQIGSLFILVVGVFTLVAGWLLKAELEEESRRSLQEIAFRELRRLEDRVSYLVETTQALTSNHFIINGLLDAEGRKTYLPRLVENFSRNRDVSAFALVDFDGRAVFVQAQTVPDYNSFPQLRKALAMDQTSIFISPAQNRLMVVAPIDYYKTTQGAVVVEFDLQHILQRLLQGEKEYAHQVLDATGVLFTFQEQPTLQMLSAQVMAGAAEMPWLNRLDMQLKLSIPASIHEEVIHQDLLRFGSVGLLFLFLAGVVAVRMGNSIADPILTLCRRVASRNGTPCSPIGTDDELEILAQTFDQQTRELRDYQETLEQRVEMRTHEVRETQKMLRTVLNAIPSRVFWKDRHSAYQGCNISFMQDVGLSSLEEVIGKTDVALPWSDRAEQLMQIDQEILNTGNPMFWREEARPIAGGESLWVRISKVPLISEQGETQGVLGVYEDITREKKSQDELKSIQQELEFQKRALDEHAIVSATDARGNITYVNDKFVAISGYARDELLGKNHRMVKSDEHSPEFYRDLWKTITCGSPWHGEVKNLARDGSFYWVRATIVPFLNEKGKPFKYISIRTDVTAMKMLESSLIVAKEQAESAVRAKSDFLANMSHEIRTPMNAIIGLSHLCLQTQLTTRQKDYIYKVHGSATSLLRIINDILDFSKIDAGRLDMESIDFTLEEVLGTMSSMIAMKAQEKKLEFLMETDVDIPPSLVGDPLRLGQILINLTNNAIKFTEQGEVVVETKMLERDDAFVRLQFVVRDSGIGMTPEQLSGLFQPFAQADASVTRKYGGTGLGLTIAKRLIEMMGGAIRVESQPGQGTRFIFDVRLGVSNQVVERLLLPSADLRGMKVLVVDDNESARNVLADYLTSFTFTVTKAKDAKDAIIAIQEEDMAGQPFELLVTDYMMPEMDGITAVTVMRRDLVLSRFPVVIMASAYGDESVVKRASQEALVDGFLVKPINQSLLFESIMEAFGRAQRDSTRSRELPNAPRDFMLVLSGAKILLVEDNELNQQVARELLEQANITVLLARNGKEAVDLVARETLDGVLMDVQMPVMDGMTATREIRKDRRFAHLPILAMTANAMSGDRELCLEAGMQDHISKPVDPQALYSTLARWVKPATPRDPLLPPESGAGENPADRVELPIISGVDTEVGVRRMGGNLKGYLSLLAKFRANQGEAETAIRSALVVDDWATAERLAHTLKGVAGAVGAESLAEQAKTLETAIRERIDRVLLEPLLNTVSSELAHVCAAVDHALSKSTPVVMKPTNQPESGEQLERRNQLLRIAAQQLAFFDAAVEQTLVDLRSCVVSQSTLDWVSQLEQQVAQYDFDGAAETLKRCATALALDLDANE